MPLSSALIETCADPPPNTPYHPHTIADVQTTFTSSLSKEVWAEPTNAASQASGCQSVPLLRMEASKRSNGALDTEPELPPSKKQKRMSGGEIVLELRKEYIA